MDGLPGKILHYLARKGKAGWKILELMERTAGYIGLVPGGEFWVIQRIPGEDSSSGKSQ